MQEALHTEDSDIDIGIYYKSESFDITAINQIATELDDENRNNLVVPPGAWGDWINGGGWLVINGYHVDLILRDKNGGTNNQRYGARNCYCQLSDWASPWLYKFCYVSWRIGDQQDTIC